MAAPDLTDAPARLGRPGGAGPVRPTRAERWALGASFALVLGALLAQAPGRIVPETKLDVLVDPVRYLGRALSAWDPSAGFGRLQNQAVGYLFPMGAWTALAKAVGLPLWITQRLWLAAVVVVGIWGAHRLARSVGIASPGGRLVAAWAYGLAPATVAVAAFQSAGQLPYSLAPWVLVPLVEARPDSSPRRVAARSALFVLAMGGVNGAAAFAVLPLVAVWFLTRRHGRERTRLFLWWAGSVVLATLWWIVPLLVSVRYGVRFTAFTEQSALTTPTESATEILRGTGNWLSYLPIRGGHWLPGAFALSARPLAIVASVVVAAGGLVGSCRRDAPHRSWLVPSAVLGAVAIGIGYAGSGGGSFASLTHHLLDGPLAPFRNVQKFAAVVRLPLALGLGHLVATWSRPARPARLARPAVAPLAVLAIVLALVPAVGGHLVAPGSFAQVPTAWRDAARWLDAHEGTHRTLVLPGSAFGEYTWGRPLDEPLASLLEGDWAIRDLIPLGGNGSTRLLDGIDSALLGDSLPPGFTTALQRAGVRYLLVRNDLDLARTGGPSPTSVRRLLLAGGFHRVRSFGPSSDDRGSDGRVAPEPGDPRLDRHRELDVYAVAGSIDRVAAYPAAGALVVGGGPEALLDLPPGSVDGRATVLAVDEPAAGLARPVRVATDTARRRDVAFGAIRNNATYTLTPGERSPATGQPPQDRWPGDGPVDLTVARDLGAATISDDADHTKLLDAEGQPSAAFDGSPATAWVPDPDEPATGRWLQVTFDRPRAVPRVTVHIPSTAGIRVGSVTLSTDRGSTTGAIGPDGQVTLTAPAGTTRTVRITIASVVGGISTVPLGLSEVDLAGVTVRRTVVAASAGRGGTAAPARAVVLARLTRDRFDRYRTDEEAVLDREVDLSHPAWITGTATASPGPALDRLLASLAPAPTPTSITATASSHWRDQPAYEPAAAVDGNPATAWVSGPDVTAPELRLAWQGTATVHRIRVVSAPPPATDGFSQVSVIVGGHRYLRTLSAGGWLTIPATRATSLVLAFPRTDGSTGTRLVGVEEVSVDGLAGRTAVRARSTTAVDLPCGQGPEVRVDGKLVPTQLSTTVGALRDGQPAGWQACHPPTLTAGPHHVVAGPGSSTIVSTMVIGATRPPPSPAPRRVAVAAWGSQHRTLSVSAGAATIVATTENHNAGWHATLGGRELPAVRVDGWRQGWIVPAGSAGTIQLRYAPGRTQALGLAAGALAVLLLVAMATLGAVGLGARHPARAWSPPAERPWPEWVLVGLAVLAGVALGGPAVVLALPLLALPHRDRWLPAVAGVATLAAGAVALSDPDASLTNHVGTLSWPAQLLAVTAVLALAVSAVEGAAGSTRSSPGRRGRRRRRSGTTPAGSG